MKLQHQWFEHTLHSSHWLLSERPILLLLLLLQARSLKDALVAMDRTTINIKEFAAWYSKYNFIAPGEPQFRNSHAHCCAAHAWGVHYL